MVTKEDKIRLLLELKEWLLDNTDGYEFADCWNGITLFIGQVEDD
jgi:hypothetical protein